MKHEKRNDFNHFGAEHQGTRPTRGIKKNDS